MNLNGKNIILTGAGSGIGREVLAQLRRYDCTVMAADLNAGSIEAVPGRVIPWSGDLSSPEAVDRLFQEAVAAMGCVDLFIANAGFAYYEEIGQADWRHIERIYRINTFSPIYAAEKMKDLNGSRPYNVAVTASAMAYLSLPGYSLYSATKASLRGFAEAYRYELGSDQHFQVIYPIATRTNFFNHAGDSPVPFPSQDSRLVAQRIIRGIERDRKSIFPSYLFRLLMIKNRFMPLALVIERQLEFLRFRNWRQSRQSTATDATVS